jgi:Domain of unknown function (DUF4124)
MSIRISLFGSLLALALLAQFTAAQTLYKSTLPDGKVIYGDKPAPGAVKVEESKPDTSKKGIAPSTTPTPAVSREAAALKQMEQDRMKREGAANKVQVAEKALRDAEAAREAGREPLGTERQGTVSGNQRFTEAYWERQKKLEDAVELARRNLEQARAGK